MRTDNVFPPSKDFNRTENDFGEDEGNNNGPTDLQMRILMAPMMIFLQVRILMGQMTILMRMKALITMKMIFLQVMALRELMMIFLKAGIIMG